MMKYLFIFISLFFTTSYCFSQKSNIGQPFIENFSKDKYNAAVQNWDIKQDSEGKILIANNSGMLIFDSNKWRIKNNPNSSITRSILVDSENIIYVGGQNTFGYFFKQDNGILKYISLSDSLERNKKQFGDIWDIIKYKNAIYFRSPRNIFKYSMKELTVFETDTYFPFIGEIDNELIICNSQKGFFKMINDKLFVINDNPFYKDEHVISIIKLNDGRKIIFTERNGLLIFDGLNIKPWLTLATDFLRNNRITSAIQINKNRIAIGTQFGGILIIDYEGKPVELLNKNSGLQSNYNRCLFMDSDSNLWAGQEKGIDLIQLNSPYRLIKPAGKLEGIAYTVKVFKDKLYFGTSSGLYSIDWSNYYNPLEKKKFHTVKNTEGQVWGLDIVGNELLLSHHDGVYRIIDTTAIKIKNADNGSWLFVPLGQDDKYCLNGNYRGLAVYAKVNGKWEFDHQLKGFDFTSRNITIFNSYVWVSLPYKGVFRLKLNSDFSKIDSIKSYGIQEGLPMKLNNFIIKIDDLLYCRTKDGLYKYDKIKDEFYTFDNWNKIFKSNKSLKYLKEEKKNKLWYLNHKELGVISNFHCNDSIYDKKVVEGGKNWLVGGFEYIYSIDSNQTFFATENGFLLYSPTNNKLDSLNLIFNKISVCTKSDSCNFLQISRKDTLQKETIDHFYKTFSFEFVVPHFTNYNPIKYQYQLKGYENFWSSWSEKNTKEYTNLPAGDFTFLVRAKTDNNQYSNTLEFPFIIEPVWFLSNIAKTSYLLLFILFSSSLIFFPKKKHIKEKEELKQQQNKIIEEHKEVIEETEEELNKVKNEKLQSELAHKNKELMSVTIHLTQKNEIILNLKDALQDISYKTKNKETAKTIKSLIRKLNLSDISKNDWNQFAKHFDQVHGDFFSKLNKKHPSLTPRDIRLCAYLRLNLTTKEIAPLMGISIRGVEISRYRIRKKLELDQETNLTQYMMEL